MNKFKVILRDVAIAVILALFVRTFLIQAYKIPTGSMVPTLLVGDHIILNRLSYGIRLPYFGYIVKWSDIQRGDVVVFEFPNDKSKDFIKRVIALEGEEVEIRNKKVYINGQQIEDKWGFFSDNNIYPSRDNWGPERVPKGHIFVLGDNRDESNDSRFWGFVPKESVKGKAFIIYFSIDYSAGKIRADRIFSLIR
ncbi:MAG: signal peptidase I [Candidatus Calescibacterium sp.]|nr:signal peptidase I [Candidatus Calescibacterium sp.]MCX7734217.1 signal peptidase I [bacterium]MDW8087925.1 signal peptidase I [Candidatus Calescibacterium sp.]